MRFSFGSIPAGAAFAGTSAPPPPAIESTRSTLSQDHRLIHVELEISLRARERHRVVVAEHLHRHHRQRLALRRVDFARHDRRSRLVFRNLQLRDSRARPAGVPAHVVGDLHQRARQRAQRRAGVHHGVVRGKRGEFVARLHERLARLLRDLARRRLAKARVRVQPGAHRRSAHRQLVQPRQARANRLQRLVELRHPARNHLPQRQRRRVLQMRPPHHHDSRERLRFPAPACRAARRSPGSTHSPSPPPSQCASPSETYRSTTGCG